MSNEPPLTVHRENSETFCVSSPWTRGKCASVLVFNNTLQVVPFLRDSHMQGITYQQIKDAVYAFIRKEDAEKRRAQFQVIQNA